MHTNRAYLILQRVQLIVIRSQRKTSIKYFYSAEIQHDYCRTDARQGEISEETRKKYHMKLPFSFRYAMSSMQHDHQNKYFLHGANCWLEVWVWSVFFSHFCINPSHAKLFHTHAPCQRGRGRVDTTPSIL